MGIMFEIIEGPDDCESSVTSKKDGISMEKEKQAHVVKQDDARASGYKNSTVSMTTIESPAIEKSLSRRM